MTDRAEQDGVVTPQHLDAVWGHHASVLEVVVASPLIRLRFDRRPVSGGGALRNFKGSGRNFRTNSVSWNQSD